MTIQKAQTADHIILTDITKKSKAYWGYDAALLEKWDADLTITPAYIAKNHVYKLLENETVLGYYAFEIWSENTIKLDNLFVAPEYIGKGFGQTLLLDFLQRVGTSGVIITLKADPNAESFYQKFGFETIGKSETAIKDRFLPIMQIKF